jgi:5-methylcytosine-specific restriction endonuclease McrA
MAARKAFMEQSGYPDGRPGYVVDHIIPLYKGGKDTPENMQWITVDQHKEKHREL